MGTGHDLWLVNLKTGAHRLLQANTLFAWEKATWTKDHVYLTGDLPALEVNTSDYTVKPVAIPERRFR
jgi:hypothetical protein